FDRRRILSAIPTLAFGLVGIGILKPYVLFPLVLASGGWLYASRPQRLRTSYKILGIVFALGGLFIMARIFPEFGGNRLAENVLHQQRGYTLVGGGSNVEFGDVEDDGPPSLLKQVKFLPLALVNALARPLLFEARGPSVLVAALEMTVVVGLII